MPGVGLITASTFVAIIDDPRRFPDIKKLWSFCGIGLVNRESDGVKEPCRLNKNCHKLLKYMLKVAALDATRSDNQFTRKYNSLIERNMSRSLARLVVARSICSTIWSMWKSGKEFELRTEDNKKQITGGNSGSELSTQSA